MRRLQMQVPRPRTFRPRQPRLIYLVAGFAVLIMLGTALLMLPIATSGDGRAGFTTALFTSTSAVCVTGLVVVDTHDYWSRFGQGVILVLIQLGGLGFMTSATLVLLLFRRRMSLRQSVTTRESLGRIGTGGLAALVRRIVLATLAIEVVGAVLLVVLFSVSDGALSGSSVWRGLFTGVSAFNNAGFDVEGGFRSLSAFDSNAGVLLVVAALVILGGTGYAVWSDVTRVRGWRRLSVDTKLVLLGSVALWLAATVVLVLETRGSEDLFEHVGTPQVLLDSFASSVYGRTAGFAVFDFSHVSDATLFFLVGVMFIGGASGSTAGGIKLTTFTVLFVAILTSMRGTERVTVFDREIPWTQVNRGLAVALLAVAVVFALAFGLSFSNEGRFVDLLFEGTSAFATVGWSTGITPGLDDIGRILLVVGMFVGRVGPLTLAVALSQRTVKGPRIRYPEEQVSIG